MGFLKPTLWRTCRALANHRRLVMLRVLAKEREMTVSQIADAVRLPVATVSANLRMLVFLTFK